MASVYDISFPNVALNADNESVFAPIDRAQERQAKQNALAAAQQQQFDQRAVRNLLASSIDPATGMTNFQQAFMQAPQRFRPELQQLQQADLLAQTELRGKRATAAKSEADAAKTENERMAQAMQTLASLTGASVDESSYQTNLQTARDMGFDVSNAPANFDPSYVRNQNLAAIDAAKRFELEATRERDKATAANQRGTLSVAQRNAAVNEAAEARMGAGAATADKNLPGKKQLSSIIDKMRGAYETLRTEGAAVQPGGDVLGNIGARLRGTGVAQAVEGTIGTKAQSERTKIKNMRPLLVNAIKQATGMSAQQMNSNVELKLFLDTATNPDTADIDANLAALENLNALYGLGLDVGSPSGGGRTVVKTGTLNGRKVVQYSDGSTEYAD
jgi:hypothetical protein